MRPRLPVVTLLRGAAVFVGVFLAVGALQGLLSGAPGAAHWLVDLRGLPEPLRGAFLGSCGGVVAWWGTAPHATVYGRRFVVCAAALLAAAAATDAAQVLAVSARGGVDLAVPPLSVAVCVLFGGIAWRARRPAGGRRSVALLSAGGCAVGFALALMASFGSSDYRRQADAVVVLGARAYADGRASAALADRVRTAAALVREGYAPLLVVSGGPGDGTHHETDVMRRVAMAEGVPAERIVADVRGLDTRATARHASALLRVRGARSALVVSHAYHLPRVKAAFDRERFRVFTVPSQDRRRLSLHPWYLAREAAAWWVYWLRDGVARGG